MLTCIIAVLFGYITKVESPIPDYYIALCISLFFTVIGDTIIVLQYLVR